ncbi:MAG: flavodoxin domain-containing protein [Acidimicrobiia bacterium]|nr:flavodoxin domain-containing protein [Acidimicrobiia bacterium]
MRSVVVYESMYGNTHAIANEIARGLEPLGSVRLGTTEQVPMDAVDEADLVVVGGPTHVHGMSSAASRRAAAETAAADDEIDLDDNAGSPGLGEWFDMLLADGRGRLGAAFDTRIDKPVLITGSAAKGIGKRLRRHGFDLVTEPECFLVTGSEGPLVPGELDRALRWGEKLAGLCHGRSSR